MSPLARSPRFCHRACSFEPLLTCRGARAFIALTCCAKQECVDSDRPFSPIKLRPRLSAALLCTVVEVTREVYYYPTLVVRFRPPFSGFRFELVRQASGWAEPAEFAIALLSLCASLKPVLGSTDPESR